MPKRLQESIVLPHHVDHLKAFRGGDVPLTPAQGHTIEALGEKVHAMVWHVEGKEEKDTRHISRGNHEEKGFYAPTDTAATDAFLNRDQSVHADQNMERLEEKAAFLAGEICKILGYFDEHTVLNFLNGEGIKLSISQKEAQIGIAPTGNSDHYLSAAQSAHRKRRVHWQKELLSEVAKRCSQYIDATFNIEEDHSAFGDLDRAASSTNHPEGSQLEIDLYESDGEITVLVKNENPRRIKMVSFKTHL